MAKKVRKESNNLGEIYGIALIAGAALFVLFLVSPTIGGTTGIVGSNTVLALKYLVGVGRYLIPAFLLGWGITFLLPGVRVDERTIGLGLFIFFVSLLSLIHLAALDYRSIPLSRAFDVLLITSYGGITGACFAFVLGTLLRKGAYIVIVASLIIGGLLATSLSLSQILSNLMNGLRILFQSPRLRRFLKLRPLPARVDYSEKIAEERRQPATLIVEEVESETPPEFAATTSTRKTAQLKMVEREPTSTEAYQFPPLSLLKRTSPSRSVTSKKGIKENINILERTLRNFDVNVTVSKVVKGPTVTRFELQLATGVKVNRILSLADDIALALATADVRILAPIPGKSAIGIEVPNQYRELVTVGDILASPEAKDRGALTVGIGKDIAGCPVLADLGDMPHLLIAGATGSGKSVCINSLLVSVLTRSHPNDVKIILIDPKRIELALFNHLPHLLVPVITNPKQAATILTWVVGEMEHRFEILSEFGARNIDAYNRTIKARDLEVEPMPYILIVIDELADLMMASPGEVEDAICRIAQMARAVGIHLAVATQRPSVDIITGLIKANITTRIAFAVSSQIDSRVILDAGGAEKLVGKGDMLFIAPGLLKPKRIQGAFVTEQEIEMITNFIKKQAKPHYDKEILQAQHIKSGYAGYEDELLDDAMELVVTTGLASVSMLQRRLRVGYARAARLIDVLEERGIVGSYEGSKPRAVLITRDELEQVKRSSRE